MAYGGEPNYDQLSNSLPYLDAVVHETLWLHSPVTELTRIVRSLSFHLYLTLTSQATVDDMIPLSEPACTRSGDLVDSITIAKGTRISVPVACINRSSTIWGLDAREFRPEDGWRRMAFQGKLMKSRAIGIY